MRKKYSFLLPLIALLIIVPLILALMGGAFQTKVGAEMLIVAEKAITRAAIQCYALEGFYPPNLDYLIEHYGVVINEKRLYVDYIYLGSNLLPDITVLPKG